MNKLATLTAAIVVVFPGLAAALLQAVQIVA